MNVAGTEYTSRARCCPEHGKVHACVFLTPEPYEHIPSRYDCSACWKALGSPRYVPRCEKLADVSQAEASGYDASQRLVYEALRGLDACRSFRQVPTVALQSGDLPW